MSDGSNFSRLLPTVDDSVDAARVSRCDETRRCELAITHDEVVVRRTSVCFMEIFADRLLSLKISRHSGKMSRCFYYPANWFVMLFEYMYYATYTQLAKNFNESFTIQSLDVSKIS